MRTAAGNSAERGHLLDRDDAEQALDELLDAGLISMIPGSPLPGSEKLSYTFDLEILFAQFGRG